MAKLEGVEKLLVRLAQELQKKVQQAGIDVTVSYSAPYAIYVHEMDPVTLGMQKPRPSGIGWFWGPSDYGPKFLERPLRQRRWELRVVIRDELAAGRTLPQALLKAGLLLQRISQELVPVEYGNLKRSARTVLHTYSKV